MAATIAILAVHFLGPAVGPAGAHSDDECRAELTDRADAAVAYEVGCTSVVAAPHDVEEVTLTSTHQPFAAVEIRNPAGNSTSCELSGRGARCVAPPETAGVVYVSARLAGPLACGTPQASYVTVGATYGDSTFATLGPEHATLRDYERDPETPGPCYEESVDVWEVVPAKAKIGKRTCFVFHLGFGGDQTGYEPPFTRDRQWSLEGGVLRFAGKRTQRFERWKRDFWFEARICKRFREPGRFKAKLTKPASGDIFHFPGTTQTVRVRP